MDRGAKISNALKNPPLTHFLCIPLILPKSRAQFEHSLRKFREAESSPSHAGSDATPDGGRTPIHPKAIRPVGTLHLTLGVMSLQGERLHQAIEYLHSLDIAAVLREAAASSGGPTKSSQISDKVAATETRLKSATPRLRITVKGLESMHSPQSTSILYAVPKDTAGTLYAFCLAMQDLFKERGFLVDENRKLKLHATIVNTIYAKGRKPPSLSPGDRDGVPQMVDNASSSMKARRPSPNDSQGHGPKANAPLKMDASLILEKYKDFVWADDVLLDRIAVCEMGAKKIKDTSGNVVDEQYTEIANRPLIL